MITFLVNLAANRDRANATLTMIKRIDLKIARLNAAKEEREVAVKKISSEIARHVNAASSGPEHGTR